MQDKQTQQFVLEKKIKVLGIDPGFRNMGMVMMEGTYNVLSQKVSDPKVVWWRTIDILGEKYRPKKHTKSVFTEKLCNWLNSKGGRDDPALQYYNADIVLIENQMKDGLKAATAALQEFYWPKSHIIHPLTYKSGQRAGHKNNKIQSIFWLKQNFEAFYLLLSCGGYKVDDIADAAMLAKYGLDNFADLSKVDIKSEKDELVVSSGGWIDTGSVPMEHQPSQDKENEPLHG